MKIEPLEIKYLDEPVWDIIDEASRISTPGRPVMTRERTLVSSSKRLTVKPSAG